MENKIDINTNKKYFILGSCVTRDIFNFIDESEQQVVDYFARTTIPSIVSSPILLEEKDINLNSPFQRRLIMRDFNKSIFNVLENTEFDYLIIDLYDERFDLFQIEDSFITFSNEFSNSGLEKDFNGVKVENNLKNWEAACKIFAEKLLEVVPIEKIIIHEVYETKKYLEDNKKKKFDIKMNIRQKNIISKKRYKIFKKMIKAKVVKGRKNLIANPKHQWGLTPIHFVDEYYLEIYNQIKKAIR